MDLQQRIAQFRNMAEADPDNDMAHFSLGSALLQAGEPAEAARSLARAIELNPDFSKAYQLAAEAHLQAGDADAAREILQRGYPVAARRGDVLPRDAMRDMLEKLGAPVPELDDAAVLDVPEGTFICHASGRPGTRLEKPPFRGPLGQKIYECISAETWRAWIGQGTKVINELRLDLSRDDHQKIYDEHMIEYLNLEDWARENLDRK